MTEKEFAVAVIYGLHFRMPARLRHKSRWTMNRETWEYLAKLLGEKGDEPHPELLGLPVVIQQGATGVRIDKAPESA